MKWNRLVLALVWVAACGNGAHAPAETEPQPPAELEPAGLQCHLHATGWAFDGLVAALEDQRESICACFKEAPEGSKIYVSLEIGADGAAATRFVGHADEARRELPCFRERLDTATANWLTLKPGWFASPEKVKDRLAVRSWDGIICRPDEVELPVGAPHLSREWLIANPDGVLYPQELPEPECLEVARRNLRLNFTLELQAVPETPGDWRWKKR